MPSQGQGVIADYGMAKLIEELTKNPQSTTLQNSGSTRWLAPEVVNAQTSSEAPPIAASDAYSFGMTMLEMLTEKIPFAEHNSDMAIIKALMRNQRPRRPEPVAGQEDPITNYLWDLMMRCWSREPEGRPTMQELIEALERA